MSLSTPTDFLATACSSASDKFPAPGISRSITYCGIATSPSVHGSRFSGPSGRPRGHDRDIAGKVSTGCDGRRTPCGETYALAYSVSRFVTVTRNSGLDFSDDSISYDCAVLPG